MDNPMIKEVAVWIEELKEFARQDENILISWFGGTKDKPVSIIAGWLGGFSESDRRTLCMSKSQPDYAMCIKIAINEGPYAYTDFEIMNMPYDPDTGEVDDTCTALEYDDDSEVLAEYLVGEWERIMKDLEENDKLLT